MALFGITNTTFKYILNIYTTTLDLGCPRTRLTWSTCPNWLDPSGSTTNLMLVVVVESSPPKLNDGESSGRSPHPKLDSTWLNQWRNSSLLCDLSSIQNSHQVCRVTWWLFFIKLEFLKLKLHDKLEFVKLEFQNSGRSLIILQTVIEY